MLSSGLLQVGRIPWGRMDPDSAGDPLPGKGHGGHDDHASSNAERGGASVAGMGSGSVVNIVRGRAGTEEPV